MSKQFKGYGPTIDHAVTAAAEAALKEWKSRGPDDMAVIKLDEVQVLYGGFVGHIGTRVATVSIDGQVASTTLAASAAGGAAPTAAQLSLKLDVLPDVIYANLMPPVRRLQPHKINFLLSVSNTGNADFSGQSPDSGVVRFSVLRGRTSIWQWPEITNPVITPVKIRVG